MEDITRIVHVVPCDGIGGVEVAARSMLTRDLEGCAFTLLLISGRALAPSAHVVEGRYGSLYNPVAHLAALREILARRPDVLVCSMWWSVPVCLLAKLILRRTRLVSFLHLERPMHPVDNVLTRLCLLVADEVWADSAETLAGRHPPAATPHRVVSFVTDRVAAAAPAAAIGPRFTCWARIVSQKGFDRAIALIAQLRSRGIDAHFDIYGPDGGEQATLERQISQLGLEGHVVFRGPLGHDELRRVAAENSFFLQLSRFEGMAIGVVEAMQLGLVPVVTPVGQMKTYVGKDNGLVVDVEDMAAAADRVAALLGDPERCHHLRENALAYWQRAPLYADDVCSYARALSTSS